MSVKQAAAARPTVVAHWPSEVTARLDRAILSVSVVTLAELRGGQIAVGFSPERVERDRKLIDTYLHVPLDLEVSETWAHLSVWAKRQGRGIGDNDLWIAATAASRGWPLVGCDRHFIGLPDLEYLYLQRKPDSRPGR